MRFEWDEAKARQNFRRHRVWLFDAKSAFQDPLRMFSTDNAHSATEKRERLIGQSLDGRLLVVTFTRRRGTIRLISARRATKRERHGYENG